MQKSADVEIIGRSRPLLIKAIQKRLYVFLLAIFKMLVGRSCQRDAFLGVLGVSVCTCAPKVLTTRLWGGGSAITASSSPRSLFLSYLSSKLAVTKSIAKMQK